MGEARGSIVEPLAELVGRAAELEAVDRFLDHSRTELAGLLVEGDAGIGKTSLWRAAVHRAESSGARVLRATPTEPERALALGGLTDLLDPVSGTELAALPPPQRHALEIALLRAAPSGELPDQRAISVATATLIRLLASRGPLVIAIDDAQWLDDATTSVLLYGVRRAADAPVGLLLASRAEVADRASTVLAGVPLDRQDRARLGPLPLAALHQLFLARLGHSFPRLHLVRIEQASGGNPFFAIEIARSLVQAGADALADGRVPIPERLGSLLETRLKALPEETGRALLLVALAADPTIDTLRRADARAPEALAAAFAAGVATMAPRAVRFSHPLLGEALIDLASPETRREAHADLARTATSDEARARHLAGATEGPDESVAAALEQAAAAARDRGATLDAAAMYEQAAALTPESSSGRAAERSTVRARLAAETLFIDVSDYVQADRILEAAIEAAQPGPARAEAMSLRALVRYYHGRTPEAVRLGQQAMDEAGDDPVLRARVMGRAAFLVMQLDLERGNAIIADALAVLGDVPDDRAVDRDLRANLLLLHASSELGLVRGYRADEVERGTALISDHGRTWEHDGADGIAYGLARQLDQVDRAIAMTERLIAAKAGPGGDDPFNLVSLSGLQVLRGDLAAADASARAAVEGYAHEGADVFPSWRLRGVALVAAYTGHLDDAQAMSSEGLDLALEAGDLALEAYHRHILGFVALSRDDPREAFEQLTRGVTAARASGTRHPGRFKLEGDLVEAAIGAGERAEAERTVTWLEEVARIAPTPWTLVMAPRGRGLLHASSGDLEAALASMDEALQAHASLSVPFERGRTLLHAGIVHRRRKEKRRADERLTEALGIFEAMGTPVWAERTRAALARVGRRRRAASDLTDTEERIAELAAGGLSARQIAERAFVAQKTVGNVLGRVYEKLGIHSRAELGAVMRERGRDRSG